MTAVLAVDELTVRHGGLVAVDAVTFAVGVGEIAGLIGPNGAGKTTLIDTVSGFTEPASGEIRFEGVPIAYATAQERARRGLVRTFQSLELFDDLTVRENLLVGESTPTWWSTVTDAFWPKRHRSDASDEVLDFLAIGDLADRQPPTLSNGQRHLVALGRALVSRPRLVLLDEPAAGLDPVETAALSSALRQLPARDTSVLLVDHDMSLVLGVCDKVHVLDFGQLIASGPPLQIRSNPTVIAAYLGTDRSVDPLPPDPAATDSTLTHG